MSLVKRLVEQLKQRGLTIEFDDTRNSLVLCGPGAEKTPDVIDAVKKFKPELLKMYAPQLAEQQSMPQPRESQSPPEPSADADELESESCRACLATVYGPTPEIQQVCHMVTCPFWTPESGVGPTWIARERGRFAK
jgi:hypothetical protein